MGDDQRMLSIDCALQIIGRLSVATHHHEADLRFRMMLQLFERGLHASAIEFRGLLGIQLLHTVEIAL